MFRFPERVGERERGRGKCYCFIEKDEEKAEKYKKIEERITQRKAESVELILLFYVVATREKRGKKKRRKRVEGLKQLPF